MARCEWSLVSSYPRRVVSRAALEAARGATLASLGLAGQQALLVEATLADDDDEGGVSGAGAASSAEGDAELWRRAERFADAEQQRSAKDDSPSDELSEAKRVAMLRRGALAGTDLAAVFESLVAAGVERVPPSSSVQPQDQFRIPLGFEMG